MCLWLQALCAGCCWTQRPPWPPGAGRAQGWAVPLLLPSAGQGWLGLWRWLGCPAARAGQDSSCPTAALVPARAPGPGHDGSHCCWKDKAWPWLPRGCCCCCRLTKSRRCGMEARPWHTAGQPWRRPSTGLSLPARPSAGAALGALGLGLPLLHGHLLPPACGSASGCSHPNPR